MSTPSVFLSDADCTLYHGDALETLRELPAESVDCVVTSPPYWGLRDYGTGAWEGGDAECDHLSSNYDRGVLIDASGRTDGGASVATAEKRRTPMKNTCGKCGATRIDQQLGLEPTLEQYVERMVEVFREVRRVLAAHGTCWLNLGDSYNAYNGNRGETGSTLEGRRQHEVGRPRLPSGAGLSAGGLKQKDLVGVPWRVAFALQADGWYLRSDIIWAKPNPMPESVTDRPTKAHEYVFLLSKQPRYFFDQEAVREPYLFSSRSAKHDARGSTARAVEGIRSSEKGRARAAGAADGTVYGATSFANSYGDTGRNIRSVWEIATQPYPEAHFATFPEELARRAIAAGCPEQVCRVCGKARERVVDLKASSSSAQNWAGQQASKNGASRKGGFYDREAQTLGFTDCGCLLSEGDTPGKGPNAGKPSNTDSGLAVRVGPLSPSESKYRPGIVLDPFMGSGTVAYVARKLGRHSIGIDLNAEYLELAARRLQQQSLFSQGAA